MTFKEFFNQATRTSDNPNGFEPYPYQKRLADCALWPDVLSVPTGVGKTAAIILSWLYRRRYAGSHVKGITPRRLVYCLPMRTLVEQTDQAAQQWLANLQLDEGDEQVSVHILMGGVDQGNWDRHPERDGILIGTQDMLLSRALNRGYGMNRYMWPVHFALLNNDCQWVLDETQLMGVGMTTSAQLAGLREKLHTYGTCRTLWMSATLDADALDTIDHPRPDQGWSGVSLDDEDTTHESVRRLISASKPCRMATTRLTTESRKKGYEAVLAEEVLNAHHEKMLTLLVMNRVDRAQATYQAIKKALKKHDPQPDVCLIHSRFRPHERSVIQGKALDEKSIPAPGRIVIATQAIEAGVDVSATILFTELAPWSSLVQRFGRCNRRGTCGLNGTPAAQVFWIDIDSEDEKKAKPLALPYEVQDLNRARQVVNELNDVGPQTLSELHVDEPRPIVHVIRRKDLLELFDTTPDLSGNDLDVSRYIREGDDTDVQVYWRNWDVKDTTLKGRPPQPKSAEGHVQFPGPVRDELCAVSISDFRAFVEKLKTKRLTWRWNPLDGQWEECGPNDVRPGMTVLLHVSAGGYDAELGWTGNPKNGPVPECSPVEELAQRIAVEEMDDDDTGKVPVLLTQHLRDVAHEAESLRKAITIDGDVPWDEIVRAAWWHDVGKAHPAFQAALRRIVTDLDASTLWAKSGKRGRLIYEMPDQSRRPGFRHELASALAWLTQHDGEPNADLIAYLIAAHHGKVRLSIRSMPNEKRPSDSTKRFARGLWDDDPLPEVEVGNGDVCNELTMNLRLMELGEDDDGRPSWLARTLALRDQYGPFRLACLETLLRVADWRGSEREAE